MKERRDRTEAAIAIKLTIKDQTTDQILVITIITIGNQTLDFRTSKWHHPFPRIITNNLLDSNLLLKITRNKAPTISMPNSLINNVLLAQTLNVMCVRRKGTSPEIALLDVPREHLHRLRSKFLALYNGNITTSMF